MTSNRIFRTGFALSALALAWACGKDLSQVFFHPSVDERVQQSFSDAVTKPAAITPADPNNFAFALMGDIQMRDDGRNYLTRFAQDVAPKGISFFVVLGDLTEDGTASQMALAKSTLDSVGIPYYTTIGNHDLLQDPKNGGWSTWKSTFGAATYSLTIANAVKLIMIDTASGEVGPRQFRWLESQLAESGPIKVVGSHYPIYDGMTPTMFRLSSVEERYKLTSMLDGGGVYSFVSGHVHGYRQSEVARVSHFIVGSMYPYELDYGTHGYLLFRYNNGVMSWERVSFE